VLRQLIITALSIFTPRTYVMYFITGISKGFYGIKYVSGIYEIDLFGGLPRGSTGSFASISFLK